jgi:hypothetical protein
MTTQQELEGREAPRGSVNLRMTEAWPHERQ